MAKYLIRRRSKPVPDSGMAELLGKSVEVAFRSGTRDVCIVLGIDHRMRYVKLCYADDPETIFWKNLTEISSFNYQLGGDNWRRSDDE